LDTDSTRTVALRVLASSGRLPTLIESTRKQLEKAPNSVAIHHSLADYYTAARQQEQAGLEMARIVELRPDAVELRVRLSLQLAEGGDFARALTHYRAAFEKNASTAASSIYEAATLFQRGGKSAELIALLN